MDASARTRVATRLAELVAEHSVPGAQLAIHHDDRTWSWSTGETRHGSGLPMTDDDAVPIGSITKVVTAAAVLALAADGDLELDEPLAEQVAGLAAFGEITPRHLLSHTAGLPSDTRESALTSATSLRRLLHDSAAGLTPIAEPGTAFSYSNVGYLLLGHAIESITGMDWDEAVTAIVLGPLEVDTRFVVGPRASTDVVTGHTVNRSRGLVRPVGQSLTPLEAPAGALAASAWQLVRLGRSLAGAEGNDLLDPGSLKDMRGAVASAEPFGMADGWGLGLAVYGSGERAVVGHDGTGDGTSAHLRMHPSSGTVVAFTANSGSGFALWRTLADELAELGIPVSGFDPMPSAVDPVPAPADAAGDYANGDTVYTVAQAVEGLRLTVDGEPFADLTPLADLRFAMRDCDTGETDQVGRFLTDHTGSPAWLQVGGRLARKTTAAFAAA
ncbi:serine hydrolase domain-containing protein [Actinokineospora diospyrosa]|uniref:CubicO group peptidase, beta-lactamase class C family n=1 Tax=Actinokineospora diospyrosa TaxID=103728 RepID=A0ABT1I576_9PSEU|nr:serine hydrolase domain-containing protein [Actinokineospora diospyrosa]MCP2267765.1 CubicO group peptidase, beta-lactamase class C family [Actinokineospora diospyrosa]